MGDNGTGKSTIAKLMLGLYRPDCGLIKLFGRRISWGCHYPELGYIGDPSYLEGGMALPTDLRVGLVLDAYAKLCGLSSAPSLQVQLREDLGLNDSEICCAEIGTLSKGQR